MLLKAIIGISAGEEECRVHCLKNFSENQKEMTISVRKCFECVIFSDSIFIETSIYNLKKCLLAFEQVLPENIGPEIINYF